MRPSFVKNDSANCGLPNAELPTEFRLRGFAIGVFSADYLNLLFGKLVNSVHTAAGVSLLAAAIVNIVLDGPKKQVVNVAAHSVVAAVQNPESIWDRAISLLPRETMSGNRSMGVAHADFSVSPLVPAASPVNATTLIGWSQELCKTFCVRSSTKQPRTFKRAATLAAINAVFPSDKLTSTLFASHKNIRISGRHFVTSMTGFGCLEPADVSASVPARFIISHIHRSTPA